MQKSTDKVNITHVKSKFFVSLTSQRAQALALQPFRLSETEKSKNVSPFVYTSIKSYRVFAITIAMHLQLHFHIEHSFSFSYIVLVSAKWQDFCTGFSVLRGGGCGSANARQ